MEFNQLVNLLNVIQQATFFMLQLLSMRMYIYISPDIYS